MTTIGIIQPNYIPWRGYFDFIHEVDIFVFLDDVQYTAQDWRNRNRVKVKSGDPIWLTVPVISDSKSLINEVGVDHRKPWAKKHLATLQQNYGKTPFFNDYREDLTEILNARHAMLADLDISLISKISEWLGIHTRFVRASELGCSGIKDERLLQIVSKLGANAYLSGPAAKSYLQPALWKQAGVDLTFKNYDGYPEYQQISDPFEPAVSVLDLLFMKGPEAPDFIWNRVRKAA